MLQVSDALYAALNSPTNQPVDLYELYLDSGTLYFADQDITWNGHAYIGKVSGRDAIKRYETGQFDSTSITFSNVDTALAQLLLSTEIEGRRIIIRKIERTVPNESLVLFNGRMERANTINETEAVIAATQLLGSIDFDAPARLFSVFCPWDLASFECGYAGTEGDCDKSWARCCQLANSPRFGGFRYIPHSGTYQYDQVEKKRFLLLFSRKKTKHITAAFNSVDDTPYDVPIPIVYGRVQLAGIDIQHEDQGGVTKALVAFCGGPINNVFYLRANSSYVTDHTDHHGELGGTGSQLVDPRFPQSYEYNLLAYCGVTIPSDVASVDPAPDITAIIQGLGVSIFGPGGVFDHWGWTDNPVWCTRNFLTLPLSQGGLGVPETEVDDVVNAETAAYCDETIFDSTNDQKIYNPTGEVPSNFAYERYQSTGVEGVDVDQDGPYATYTPGVDDDTSTSPAPVAVKRFTMNVTIAKQEKAVDILYNKLLPSFRGYLTHSKDGKIQIRSERPAKHSIVTADSAAAADQVSCSAPEQWAPGELVVMSPLSAHAEVLTVDQVLSGSLQFVTPARFSHAVGDEVLKVAMTFDDSNIVGNFEYPLSTDRQPSTNRITIKYVDSPAGFEARELRINDYAHQAQVHKVNNQDLDGSAIDSYFQAWRIGQWARGKARDLGRFCSFDADIKATLIEVGDVIAVSAGEVGLAAVPFRVIEVGFNENDEVSLVGQLYSSAIYDDQAPQTTVSVPTIFSSVTGESTATVTLNPPANTDTHLPLGNLVVNVVANSAAHGPVLIYLPAEASDSGNTVTVKWMAGNTQDVHVVEASGDTIDGLSTPVVLNAENPIWTGVAS